MTIICECPGQWMKNPVSTPVLLSPVTTDPPPLRFVYRPVPLSRFQVAGAWTGLKGYCSRRRNVPLPSSQVNCSVRLTSSALTWLGQPWPRKLVQTEVRW